MATNVWQGEYVAPQPTPTPTPTATPTPTGTPAPTTTPSPTPAPLMARTQSFTATAGQILFTLTDFTYTIGAYQLMVFVNGVFQNPANYTETTTSSITLGFSTLNDGDIVDITKVA